MLRAEQVGLVCQNEFRSIVGGRCLFRHAEVENVHEHSVLVYFFSMAPLRMTYNLNWFFRAFKQIHYFGFYELAVQIKNFRAANVFISCL